MFRRIRTSRPIVVSWILGTALALLSAAAVFADGNGTPFAH
ncbi:MAG: hypothetical protein V4515_11470 [Chloroflexota bacterium]